MGRMDGRMDGWIGMVILDVDEPHISHHHPSAVEGPKNPGGFAKR